MTVSSAKTERVALWRSLLVEDFGYEETEPSRGPSSANELVIATIRPGTDPIKPVRFEIHETWVPGRDPQRLVAELGGCYLRVSSWHAQVFADTGDGKGAERLDVDRRKPPKLVIHRHPLGQINDVRVAAAPLKHPDAWVGHVESLIADHYGF